MSTAEALPPYAPPNTVGTNASAPPIQQVQYVQPQQPQQIQYVNAQGQPVQMQYVNPQGQPIQYVNPQGQPVQSQPVPVQYVNAQGQPVQYVNPQPQAVPIQYVPTTAPLVAQSMIDPALKQSLLQIASNQLVFFDTLYQHHSTLIKTLNYDPKELIEWKGIIEDYEDYMYTLCANANIAVKMSIEMELVWRVHMLNPTVYFNDCMRCFGKLIGHNCANPSIQYVQHNQVNFLQEIGGKPQGIHRAFIGSSLVMTDAILRQLKFVARMVNIHHKALITQQQLIASIDRYDKFMQCMFDPNKPSASIMVPTLDIDLIWHSHQLDPASYYNFCISRSPSKELISHNDNLSDNVLNTERSNTEGFWDSKFGASDYNGTQAFTESVSSADTQSTSAVGAAWSRLSTVQKHVIALVIVIILFVIIGVAAGYSGTAGWAIFAAIVGFAVIACYNGYCACGGGGGRGGGRRGGGASCGGGGGSSCGGGGGGCGGGGG